jgi:hypothetical protein
MEMETQQSNLNIGLIFWPTLAMMYGLLISSAVWYIWG